RIRVQREPAGSAREELIRAGRFQKGGAVRAVAPDERPRLLRLRALARREAVRTGGDVFVAAGNGRERTGSGLPVSAVDHGAFAGDGVVAAGGDVAARTRDVVVGAGADEAVFAGDGIRVAARDRRVVRRHAVRVSAADEGVGAGDAVLPAADDGAAVISADRIVLAAADHG